jgi:hypothetical protein
MKNGPSAAAILAGGIGVAVLGILALLTELAASVNNALVWNKSVGSLSGKTIIEVAVWLVAWLVLGLSWKDKEVNLRPILIVSVILAAVGVLFTFPPVWSIFTGHD